MTTELLDFCMCCQEYLKPTEGIVGVKDDTVGLTCDSCRQQGNEAPPPDKSG